MMKISKLKTSVLSLSMSLMIVATAFAAISVSGGEKEVSDDGQRIIYGKNVSATMQGARVRCDRGTVDKDGRSFQGSGGCSMTTSQGLTIRSDMIDLDDSSGDFSGRGNVYFHASGVSASADAVSGNARSDTVTLSGNVVVSAGGKKERGTSATYSAKENRFINVSK